VKIAAAGLCGLVFGVGLAVSGLANPAKVLGFLDVAGAWDPTLLCVMAGAVAVSALGSRVAGRRERAWLGDTFAIPTRRDLDASLLGGATLFGVGWGLVGLCPGPALAGLSRGAGEIWIFVASMVVGALAHRALSQRPGAALPAPVAEPTAPLA
jgi:hypothetical protein